MQRAELFGMSQDQLLTGVRSSRTLDPTFVETAVPDLATEGQTDSLTKYDAAEKGGWKLLSSAAAAIIGAVIGAIATTAGVIVQAVLKNRADAEQRREARESDRERQRRELVQRYLFQFQDAVVSLRLRLENWAR